ncbi:MAG: rhomboid family intramembrane serine protease [Bacteroidaceae bacterium]|nr:rhomboid family intramembrane serine protease [Bacteroidaceae bacterium]
MRQMTPAVKNLLIINVLCFAAFFVLEHSRGIDLNNLLGLHFILASDFMPYQFVSYMFMHSDIMHLFFNMFALWMFGCIIEQTMGTKRFLTYYFVCGIGAGICQEVAQFVHYSMLEHADVAMSLNGLVHGQFVLTENGAMDINWWSTVGASGAVYGILLAFAMYYPNNEMFIIPIPFPIKAKYLVLGYAVIEVLEAINRSNDHIAHMAHLGGMLFGLLLILYWRNKNKRRGNTQYVSFDSYNRG